MKDLLLVLVLLKVLFTNEKGFSQTKTGFAITSQNANDQAWVAIREVNLSTGEAIKDIYNPSSDKENRLAIMGQGVAATAYDVKHHRLYFTTIRKNNLRYLDLRTEHKIVMIDTATTKETGNELDEGNVISRMTFASNGYGYHLTNDGNHLIRFTTDPRSIVTDLGPLIDNNKNSTSVHAESNWGGDIVGDVLGNLLLVTQRNNIFKINVETKMTDYIGHIEGLPLNYTSNGCVADAGGDLIIASNTIIDNYFKVNMLSLNAVPLPRKNGTIYNTSDLASANLLYENKNLITTGQFSFEKVEDFVSIYPNPTTDMAFNLNFKKLYYGEFDLSVIDISGKILFRKPITVTGYGQTERIQLSTSFAKGVYLITLTGKESQIIFKQKVLVQ